ncbi:hypothetical protein CLOACE_01300 [Clostridium acetireducens DSM 10703]|jgi:hypothetical protein|uniref:Uncharacterized protein n=1 Tax=Clostridium acetireducens DSM 10703 TaxID=1121290 RepID=A0A1E8F2A6_9CLOT|nr:hypothetical protein [Clostridium acetireducens]OFI07782.1 hypothetical protein CLOACE_01300 [Clostridium acetireducens DSM 10703]
MITSNIKGRIRFKDGAFKNGEVIAKLQNEINKVEGIKNYRINERIGSLLIEYNSDIIGENKVIELASKCMQDKGELVNNIKETLKNKGLDTVKQSFGKSGSGKGKGRMSSNSDMVGNLIEMVNPLNSSNPLMAIGKTLGLGFAGQKGIKACGRCFRR